MRTKTLKPLLVAVMVGTSILAAPGAGVASTAASSAPVKLVLDPGEKQSLRVALSGLAFDEIVKYNQGHALVSSVDAGFLQAAIPTDGEGKENTEKILLLQEQANFLTDWLQKNRAGTFTSLEMLHKPFAVKIRSLDGTKEILDGAPLGNLAPLIVTEAASATREQFLAEGQDVDTALRSDGLNLDMSIEPHNDKIVVIAPAEKVDKAKKVVGARVRPKSAFLAKAASAPVSVEVVTGQSQQTDLMAHGGLILDTPKGGCSTGFGAIRPDGLRVILTAAHCGDNEATKADAGGTSYIYHGTTQMKFVVDYQHRGGAQDIQQMYGGQCCINVNNRVQDNSNDSTPRYRNITASDSIRRGIGAQVEKWGRTTGYSIGVIQTTDYKPSYIINPTASFTTASWATAGGDSGGPVYAGIAAAGIVSGVVHITGLGDRGIYMPISNSTMSGKVLTY